MRINCKTVFILLVAVFILNSCTTTDKTVESVKTVPPAEIGSVNKMPETGETSKVLFLQKIKQTLKTGTQGEAISMFDSLPPDQQSDIDLQIIKASLLVSAGRIPEAQVLGKKLEDSNGSNLDVLNLNIMIAKAAGDDAEKDSYIQKILKLDPYNSLANIELGEEQVLKHNYILARKYYQLSLIKNPSSAEGLFGYGQTSYYLDNIDDARTAFQKILDQDKNNAVVLSYMGKLEAENENYKKASDYIKQAISNDPNNYSFYLDLGNYERYLGKFDEAEQSWTKAVNLRPDYFLAYVYRGGLYDEENKLDKAYADYKKVVETNPRYYFAYESLGLLAWHEGDFSEAADAFKRAYGINKKNVSYPLMEASSLYKTNKNDDAKGVLEDAMKGLDHNSLDYAMLRLYYDMGGANAESVVTLKVQNETNRNERGKMLYYLGLYWELKGTDTLAAKYYAEVANMDCPMFFEYRLAEWSVK